MIRVDFQEVKNSFRWTFRDSWQAAENRGPKFNFRMGKGVILVRGTIKNDGA